MNEIELKVLETIRFYWEQSEPGMWSDDDYGYTDEDRDGFYRELALCILDVIDYDRIAEQAWKYEDLSQ